jgi:hypothetical protein
MERVGSFGGKADQLNGYFVQAGNPDWFNEDLSRYMSLQPNDIRAAVSRWLVPDKRIELSVVPKGRWESGRRVLRFSVLGFSGFCLAILLATRCHSHATGSGSIETARVRTCAALKLPPIQKRALANGLPVWIVRRCTKCRCANISFDRQSRVRSADPWVSTGSRASPRAMLD